MNAECVQTLLDLKVMLSTFILPFTLTEPQTHFEMHKRNDLQSIYVLHFFLVHDVLISTHMYARYMIYVLKERNGDSEHTLKGLLIRTTETYCCNVLRKPF